MYPPMPAAGRGSSAMSSPSEATPPQGGDINALMAGGADAAIPPAVNPQELRTQFLEMVRQLSASTRAIAEQYPAFAPYAEQISRACQQGMVAVVSQLGAEGPQPSPMALV